MEPLISETRGLRHAKPGRQEMLDDREKCGKRSLGHKVVQRTDAACVELAGRMSRCQAQGATKNWSSQSSFA